MGSILKGLGVKGDPKYPTPEEFVRASHGFDESSRGGGTNFVSAATLGLGGNSAPLGMPATGMEGLLQVSNEFKHNLDHKRVLFHGLQRVVFLNILTYIF